jgi:hypothetical protein
LSRRRKPHRAVAAVVAVLPLGDVVVHLPVAVDARPYVEELWELEDGVSKHRHRRPRAPKLKRRMEEPSKNRNNTSLSRTNIHRHHRTWWT